MERTATRAEQRKRLRDIAVLIEKLSDCKGAYTLTVEEIGIVRTALACHKAVIEIDMGESAGQMEDD